MTDRANELRRCSRKIGQPAGDVPSVMLAAADEIERLAAKLEAAEKNLSCCQAEREEAAALFLSIKTRLTEERDALRAENAGLVDDMNLLRDNNTSLRAKIARMEQQEPVAWMQSTHLSSFKNRLCGSQSSYVHCSDHQLHPDFKPLYALPGAQLVPSVPEVTDAMALAFHHALTDGSIGAREVEEIKDALRAALAAAPEAKK